MNSTRNTISTCGLSRSTWLLIVAMLLITTPLHAATFSFTPLGDLPGGGFASLAQRISADGKVIVGESWSEVGGFEAFRWSADEGMVGLGVLSGSDGASGANGVSQDGAVVVGVSGTRPFRWSIEEGMVDLGFIPGSNGFQVRDVSADGSVIAGTATFGGGWPPSQYFPMAFRWDETNGFVALGDLPGGGVYSDAYAISANGDVIVGASNGGGLRAFLWESASGIQQLINSSSDGFVPRFATAMSADGSIIGGLGRQDLTNGPDEAFLVTSEGDLVLLGALGGTMQSGVAAMSANGMTVIGQTDSPSGFQPYYWTETTGMVGLHELLINHHVPGLDGWTISEATDISADGRTIVGWGFNPAGQTEAWVATVPEPSSLFLAILGAPAVLLWRRMRSIRRGRATASALLFAACISNQSYASEVPSLAERGNLRVVAITGQQAPLDASGELGNALFQNGGSFRSYEWGAPVINELGQTAFRASAGWSDVLGSNVGIITEGGGTGLRLLARQNTPAPGTTSNFGPFLLNPTSVSYDSEPLISDAGTTALFARLSSGFSAIWSDHGGQDLSMVVSSLALPTGNLPDPVSRLPLYPVLDGAGHLYFNNTGGGAIRTDAGGLHSIVSPDDHVPNDPGDGLISRLLRPSVNSGGEIAFTASVDDVASVLTNAGGLLRVVARAGEQATGFPEGASYQGFSRDSVINGQGQVSFQSLVESPGELELKQGIWSDSSGQLQLIAAAGMAAPGLAGDLPFIGFGVNGPLLGDGGHNAFVGEVGSSPSESLSGLWIADSLGGLEVIAFEGMAAPGTDSNFGGFGGHADPEGFLFPSRFPALNALGHVAFMADLSSGDDYRDSLWVATTPNQLNLVVAEGDVLETSDGVFRTVAALDFLGNAGGGDGRRSGFNDAGQVAYYALFTDGYQGVFVTQVPEPSTWLLAACGGAIVAIVFWRQRRRCPTTQ